MPGAAPPFRDVVDESFQEAVFLWEVWERELTSLTRSLDEVWFWTEDRLHGALDGVAVAGRDIVEVVSEGLLSAEPAAAAASAAILGASDASTAIDALAAALAVAHGARLRALVRGVEVLGSDRAVARAIAVLRRREPAAAGALCRLIAFRRQAPEDEMAAAGSCEAAEVQIEAVRAAVHGSGRDADRLIVERMKAEDPALRLAAVESALARRIPGARETVLRRARRLDGHAGAYLRLIAVFGSSTDHDVVYDALTQAEVQHDAVWALGHLGTVRAGDACVAGMRDEGIARACGEAYAWITGADLVRDGLTVPDPQPEAPPFEDDDLDANLVPPLEAHWPLPDAEAVERHWHGWRTGVSTDLRHVRGRPATPDRLMTAVERGPMVRRHDLARELFARSHGRYDVETRAMAARQRQMMARARHLAGTDVE